MKKYELMQKMSKDDLAMFLYLNSNNTKKGLKKLTEWLDSEADDEEMEKYLIGKEIENANSF